jgi:hypothetical protein
MISLTHLLPRSGYELTLNTILLFEKHHGIEDVIFDLVLKCGTTW